MPHPIIGAASYVIAVRTEQGTFTYCTRKGYIITCIANGVNKSETIQRKELLDTT